MHRHCRLLRLWRLAACLQRWQPVPFPARCRPASPPPTPGRPPPDALRCIKALDGAVWKGKAVKACFGTTKYCNAFLKGLPCNNPDCLYLHDIGGWARQGVRQGAGRSGGRRARGMQQGGRRMRVWPRRVKMHGGQLKGIGQAATGRAFSCARLGVAGCDAQAG